MKRRNAKFTRESPEITVNLVKKIRENKSLVACVQQQKRKPHLIGNEQKNDENALTFAVSTSNTRATML